MIIITYVIGLFFLTVSILTKDIANITKTEPLIFIFDKILHSSI